MSEKINFPAYDMREAFDAGLSAVIAYGTARMDDLIDENATLRTRIIELERNLDIVRKQPVHV